MLPTAPCCFAILLMSVIGSPQTSLATGNVSAPQEGDKIAGVPTNEIDSLAVDFLRETEATYKALRSYSVEFDIQFKTLNPNVWNNSIRGRVDYRAPDYLAYVQYSEPGHYERRTDGKHLFLLHPKLPHEYIEVPFEEKSPFSICWAASISGHSIVWLQCLLSKDSLLSDLHNSGLVSLKLESKSILDGVPVQNLTAHLIHYHFEGTKRIPEPSTITFTLGTKDHLLYQIRDQEDDTTVQITRYSHPRTNPTLSDALFNPPSGALRLPLLHILNINQNSVILDKGSQDRVAVGDKLDVYIDDSLRSMNAHLMVVKVYAHDCIADIVSNIGGVSPDEACIIVAHTGLPGLRTKNAHTKHRH